MSTRTLSPVASGFIMGAPVEYDPGVSSVEGSVVRKARARGLTIGGVARIVRTLPNGQHVWSIPTSGTVRLSRIDVLTLLEAAGLTDALAHRFPESGDPDLAADPADSAALAAWIADADSIEIGAAAAAAVAAI